MIFFFCDFMGKKGLNREKAIWQSTKLRLLQENREMASDLEKLAQILTPEQVKFSNTDLRI